MDRNLMVDYGTDRYSVTLSIQDFYGHTFSGKEHRTDDNDLSYKPEGHMGVVQISNDTKGISTEYKHEKWTVFSIYAKGRDNNDHKTVMDCYQNGSDLLRSIPLDREKDITLSASRLHKWIALEEPTELLENRQLIYAMRDLIREINAAVEKAEQQAHLNWTIPYLNSMKERNVAKLKSLLAERDEVLKKNHEWKPRRYLWVNLDYFPATCSLS